MRKRPSKANHGQKSEALTRGTCDQAHGEREGGQKGQRSAIETGREGRESQEKGEGR